jgi:hypothetical protein
MAAILFAAVPFTASINIIPFGCGLMLKLILIAVISLSAVSQDVAEWFGT